MYFIFSFFTYHRRLGHGYDDGMYWTAQMNDLYLVSLTHFVLCFVMRDAQVGAIFKENMIVQQIVTLEQR